MNENAWLEAYEGQDMGDGAICPEDMGEESHLYGTIGDFCGLMDTYDAKFVWEKIPIEYRDMLLDAINQRGLQGP
jgi:hypothetical protein